MKRNRSEGWTHAKLSGHKNEELLTMKILENADYAEDVSKRVGYDVIAEEITFGGLNENHVESIYEGNRLTKSKTDMTLIWGGNQRENFSIKKSVGGQVYLVTVDNFLCTYERQFNETIPNEVKMGFDLFWGNNIELENIIEEHSNLETKQYEYKKNRIVANTLLNYDKDIYDLLLKWFKDNIYNVTILCFSRGAARDEDEWARHVWYVNLVDSNQKSLDDIFLIRNIAEASERNAHSISYGTRSGGTTIQLPFGFVQWHQRQMQFHHNHDKIKEILFD